MPSLDLAFAAMKGKGRKIEIPFRQVAELVDFRTGDLAVLAGAPGGGKSLLATNWAWRSNDPILYIAQDSPNSVRARLVALALDETYDDIIDEDQRDHWTTKVEPVVQGERPELIVVAGAHTVDMIEEQIIALTEWLMVSPKLIIIDNMMDLRAGTAATENAFYGEVLPALKQMAIKKDVGIMLLHHVTRSGDAGKKHGQGTSRLRMTDLLFAGEREARHVWATYQGWGKRELWVQILKQQDGQAEPGGWLEERLDWDVEKGRLWDR